MEQVTDANGQATVELAGNSEWGMYYDFYVTLADYENYEGFLSVYESDVDEVVVMSPAAGTDFEDFAAFGTWWNCAECSWNFNCEGFDFNYDNVVDFEDMAVLGERWLRDYVVTY